MYGQDIDMRSLAIFFALLIPAHATDYAVMLNDVERAALIDLIDAAVRAKGLDVAPNALYLANKIKAAGTVIETVPPKQQEKPQ